MELVADLHLHSKYSRAVSPRMVIPEIAKWAKKKGIDLVGTGDFTHLLWFKELRENLEEENRILKVKGDRGNGGDEENKGKEVKFLLTTEISSIFTQGGKGRRIHALVFAPSFDVVEKINEKLRSRGVNLLSDGRPITGLSVKNLAEIVWSGSSECLVIPAHIWTPWFGTYGDKGGFNSLEEAYGNLAKNIFAIETGHSSDPQMNWRIAELDNRAILSFSDAHSPEKMSRELTVLETPDIKVLRYEDIKRAIMERKIKYTVEFYPEEGKYHYTGHRKCGIKQTPEETKKTGETCPVCGKPLTVGVMHRVEELATRSAEEVEGEKIKIGNGVLGIKFIGRPPFIRSVPLMEILAESLGTGFSSEKVLQEYEHLIEKFGSELEILLNVGLEELAKSAGEKIAEGVPEEVVKNRQVIEAYLGEEFGNAES